MVAIRGVGDPDILQGGVVEEGHPWLEGRLSGQDIYSTGRLKVTRLRPYLGLGLTS